MKRLKKIFLWLAGVLLVMNIFIIATGNTYLYKATYYHKASIDDYKIFDNREVKAGNSIPLPESSKYNKNQLSPAVRSILEESNTIAYLVIQNDSVIYEEYWDDYNADSYSGSFSVAKSIVSILTGIAIDEGKIKSLDQKVSDFIPEYSEGMNAKLSIRHLLSMTAGFDFKEIYYNPFTSMVKIYFGSNLIEMVKDLKVIDEPGATFNYQSVNQLVLAYILQQATGKTISEYASEKLWKPLGAEHNALWSVDNLNGLEKAFCCFFSNARDFSRIGSLALQGGKYNGVQIVSESYISESTDPSKLNNGRLNNEYGLAWWLAKADGKDFFYARGVHGQFVIVLPAKNMVIVRLGKENIQSGQTIPAVTIAEFTIKNFIK